MDLRHGNVYEVGFEPQTASTAGATCKIVAESIANAVSLAERFWPGKIIVSALMILHGVTYGDEI